MLHFNYVSLLIRLRLKKPDKAAATPQPFHSSFYLRPYRLLSLALLLVSCARSLPNPLLHIYLHFGKALAYKQRGEPQRDGVPMPCTEGCAGHRGFASTFLPHHMGPDPFSSHGGLPTPPQKLRGPPLRWRACSRGYINAGSSWGIGSQRGGRR